CDVRHERPWQHSQHEPPRDARTRSAAMSIRSRRRGRSGVQLAHSDADGGIPTMKRNFLLTCMLAGAIAALGSCTDAPTSTPAPRIGPLDGPAYDASTPFNNAGQCMADDAVRAPTGTISGIKLGDPAATALNCTSQDVKI